VAVLLWPDAPVLLRLALGFWGDCTLSGEQKLFKVCGIRSCTLEFSVKIGLAAYVGIDTTMILPSPRSSKVGNTEPLRTIKYKFLSQE